MNGNKVLVDTNIIIYTLGGSMELADRVKGSTLFVSVITEIEALGYPGLSEEGREQVHAYISRCTIISLEDRVKQEAIRLRSQYRLKLPDAIIAATGIAFDIPLLTGDQAFEKVAKELAIDLFQIRK